MRICMPLFALIVYFVTGVSSTGNVSTLHIGDWFFVKVCGKEKCRFESVWDSLITLEKKNARQICFLFRDIKKVDP